MRRRPGLLLGLFLLVYLASLLATLPMSLLVRHLPAPAAAGWYGTPWQGEVRGLAVTAQPLAVLRWRTDVAALLTGHLQARVTLEDARLAASGTLRYGRGGALQVTDLSLAAGLPALGTLAGLRSVPLDGQLVIAPGAYLDWSGRTLTALGCTGSITGIGLRRGPELALGDLAVRCEDGEGGPRVALEDQGGPLAVQAQLLFDAQGRWSFEARLGARPGTPAVLRQALPLLGASDGPDRVRVRMSGALGLP